MRLRRIELNNFGSYRDKNVFEIPIENPQQNIVIIGGKNGAGKTTLFTAIELCLYGHLSFGYKNEGKLYTKKVFALINDQARINDDETAYIALNFDDSSEGDLDNYSICRSWSWRKGVVVEHVSATKNNSALDDHALIDFQNFLIHLIPPALLKLYFFDGERIAEYLLEEQKNNVRDALMVLSGNDTFDLMYTSVRKVLNSSTSEESSITREYLLLKSELKSLEKTKKDITQEISELTQRQEEKSAEIDQLKKEYTEQGGISLDDWKRLNSALKGEEEKRERINWERKLMAADVLPFIIAKTLVEKVHPQIIKEHEYKTWQALFKTLQTEEFEGFVSTTLHAHNLNASAQESHSVYDDIIHYLLPQNGWEDFCPLFGLSDDDETSVQAVLNRVALFNNKKIIGYKRRLDASITKAKQIREILQKSSIDNFQQHTEHVSMLNEERFGLSRLQQDRENDLKVVNAQIEVAEKQLIEAHKKLELDIKRRSVSATSSSVLLLLEELQGLLYERMLEIVKKDTLDEFKRLMRKDRFIDDLDIDRDFSVHLLRRQTIEKADILKILHRSGVSGVKRSLQQYGYNDLCRELKIQNDGQLAEAIQRYPDAEMDLMMEVNRESLSKGETQIFVMSLYWALMQQSKCDLPFIIDTPFARIDTEHRQNIVSSFFKMLPGQLFILSTNEEVEANHIYEMSKSISKTFVLEYGVDKCTHITENNYFEV